MTIEFKDNMIEVEYNGAKVVMETLSVVDDAGNIYIFDMAESTLGHVEQFIADGCPGDMAEEYGGSLI